MYPFYLDHAGLLCLQHISVVLLLLLLLACLSAALVMACLTTSNTSPKLRGVIQQLPAECLVAAHSRAAAPATFESPAMP